MANTDISYIYNDQTITVKGQRYKAGMLYKAQNSARTLTIATLNWPPYIGENLCNKGWVYHFAVALLNSQGFNVYIEFLPWARAVRNVETGKFDILMPEYFIEDTAPSDYVIGKTRSSLLGLSNSFQGGEIALLKRTDESDRFTGNLNSLKGQKIGVVRGYQNTPEFDAMMDNNEFNVVSAVDDLQLVQLLAAKRVDLIIGDPWVLKYTVLHSSLNEVEKQNLLRSFKKESKPLHYNPLYFAISNKTPDWLSILEKINQGLYIFENNGETQRLINSLTEECEIERVKLIH